MFQFVEMRCEDMEAGALGERGERGTVEWIADPARSEFEIRAKTDGLLLVCVPPPGPGARSRLAIHLETAIENALERRGAAPPGVGASSDLDASLSDQLFRARQVGARGIAISMASLEG